MQRRPTRARRLAKWSAIVAVGAFVAIAWKPDALTPAPTEAASEPASAEDPTQQGLVSGTIELPDGTSVPATATTSVEIQDTSLADAAALTIGQTTVETGDPAIGSIPFEVSYDPADIDQRNTYSLSVRIESEAGDLLFINDTHTPVITSGAPSSDVVVMVVVVETVASDGPRIIGVEATDQITFEQDGEPITGIPVTPGETVLIRVENTAGFDHNFTIGTEAELMVALSTGQAGVPTFSSGVEEFEWTVPADVTSLRFACTVPGHYTRMHGDFPPA